MPPKVSFEKAQQMLLEKHGSDISLIEYTKMSSIATFSCRNGHTWKVRASSVITEGTKCFLCGKISMLEVEKRLYEKHGNTIKLLEYTSMNGVAKFSCSKGHIWNAVARSVIGAGNRCPQCKIRKSKLTINQVEEYVNSFGCELISTEYINSTKLINIRMLCGHIRAISFTNFRIGERCQSCSMIESWRLRKISTEEIISFVESFGCEFICFPNGHSNAKSLIKYFCEKGHLNEKSYSQFQRGHICKRCSGEKLADLFAGASSSNWKGGLSPLHNFLEKRIIFWKKDSMEACNYKCVVTGESFDHIHHLYSFNLILKETLEYLKFDRQISIKDYSEEDMEKIAEVFIEIHKKYPLGVCLKKEIHDLFHKMYGQGDNTPEQWFEFLKQIKK
jgi:hypothetical protein